KGSVKLDDIPQADVVMIVGMNPGTNHPRMLSSLQKLKGNGGKVITINPLEEAGLKRFKNPQKVGDLLGSGTAITDILLQVKINQDIPLLKAIIKKLYIKESEVGGIFDHDFIQEKTIGYNELIADLEKYELSSLIQQSGVNESQIDQAVDLLASGKKIIICWAMGLTQHENGVENIKECVNLLLLKGSIGKEGAGTCPVRGHSNVQGDRSVGIVHGTSDALHASLKKTFHIEAPKSKGLDTVDAIKAMHEGKAKVFIALGGNFLSAAPDTNYTAQALHNCDLTVNISTKLNRTHVITGKTALILPTLGRSEKDMKDGKKRFVSVENSMGKVHQSQGSLAPASEHLMSEPDIIAHLAATTLGEKATVDWLSLGQDYDAIRGKISEVIGGFEDYNQRVRKNGFYLPNNARVGDFSNLPHHKAQFTICSLPEHYLQEDEYLLMTIRSHDQFNTTIYGMDDRYRGIYNERRVLFMNSGDMKKEGVSKLDRVDIKSEYDGAVRVAHNFLVIPYSIPSQNLACYFPEANVLVPINYFAKQSQTPISKSVKVSLVKV
ncbi:MAG: FdhF/YdeP family oxidoreductase, partial [Bacteroidota bacterium]